MSKFQECKTVVVRAVLFFVCSYVGCEVQAAKENPQSSPVDVFARSGPLTDSQTGQPIQVNGKSLPANASNLPPQANWELGKNQCALYLKNDIIRFNTFLKNKGESDEAIKQAHLKLDSRIYVPALRAGDDWAKTGMIPAGECRKIALSVTKALREYLKNSMIPDASHGTVAESEHAAAEGEPLSELERLKKAICQAFNPMIAESGGTTEEESSVAAKEEEPVKEKEEIKEVSITPVSVPTTPNSQKRARSPLLRSRLLSTPSITPSLEGRKVPAVAPVRALPSRLSRSQSTASLPVKSDTHTSPPIKREPLKPVDREELSKNLSELRAQGHIQGEEDDPEEDENGRVD